MLKFIHTFIIVLIVGFFANPIQVFACGKKETKTEKACSKKINKSNKTEINDCCKKSVNNKSKEDKNNEGCGGKCNHPSCSCPVSQIAFVLPLFEMQSKRVFLENKKSNSFYNETFLSSGFHSIWSPPNIA